MPKTQYIEPNEEITKSSVTRGDVLSEFFEISDKAREGGMGDVFFCRDRRDNKFYVLKTFKAETDEKIFRKEALLCLNLPPHPYIVYTRTIISDRSRYYLLMDYIGKQPYSLHEEVKGETLEQALKKVDILQALIWAIQICKGMAFLNGWGITAHRDIKPSNILISPDNDIKITDFSLTSLEKKGGTPGYIPPEYFSVDYEATIQGDIYSFGVVLYQLLNKGSFPYNVTTSMEYELDQQKIRGSVCENIIQKCLKKEPSKRYKNFQEIEEQLIQYVNQNFPHYYLEPHQTINPYPNIPNLHIVQEIEGCKKMSAQQLLLRGEGCYLLTEYKRAFFFLCRAIEKNNSLKEAYLLRHKCRLELLSPTERVTTRFIVLLVLLFLPIDSVCYFISCFVEPYTPLMITLRLLPCLFAFAIILWSSKYRDYENTHPSALLIYYMLPIVGTIGFLLSPDSLSHISKGEQIISFAYVGLALVALFVFVIIPFGILVKGLCEVVWQNRKTVTPRKLRIALGTYLYLAKKLFVYMLIHIKYAWKICFSQDAKYALKNKEERNWDIINNSDVYTTKQYDEAKAYFLKHSSDFPADVILWIAIQDDYLSAKFTEVLDRITAAPRDLIQNSIYYYDILLKKALCYIALKQEKEAKGVFKEILSEYKKYADKKLSSVGEFLSSDKLYPSAANFSENHVAKIALIAYLMIEPKSLPRHLLLANLLFDCFDSWEITERYYQEVLANTVKSSWEKIDNKTLSVLASFNEYCFKSEKEYINLKEDIWTSKYFYQKLAFCQYRVGDYVNSFNNFSRAIKNTPTNKVLHAWRLKAALKSFRQSCFYKGCVKDFFCYLVVYFRSGYFSFYRELILGLTNK